MGGKGRGGGGLRPAAALVAARGSGAGPIPNESSGLGVCAPWSAMGGEALLPAGGGEKGGKGGDCQDHGTEVNGRVLPRGRLEPLRSRKGSSFHEGIFFTLGFGESAKRRVRKAADGTGAPR